MAAIAPKTHFLTAALLLMLFGSPLLADRSAGVRSQISHIATSLGSGNAADAMEPFDQSFANYLKLSNYFQGLTVFQIENELDVTDEHDTSDTETNVTVNWAITLTDSSSNHTDHRTADINIRLVLKGRKWKIVDFSPIDIFNPLAKWDSKP
jgi:hypothetical protein